MSRVSKKVILEQIEEYERMIDGLKRGMVRANKRIVEELGEKIKWYEEMIKGLQDKIK